MLLIVALIICWNSLYNKKLYLKVLKRMMMLDFKSIKYYKELKCLPRKDLISKSQSI